MMLIQEKQGEYLVGLDVVDTRDQFESASCNWQKIIDFCKCKWLCSLLLEKMLLAKTSGV